MEQEEGIHGTVKKVLIIDDFIRDAESTQGVLENEGHNVKVFITPLQNPLTGLDGSIKDYQPDVAVVDGLGSLGLCCAVSDAIRELKPDIEIVIYSGSSSIIRDALEKGYHAYEKPWSRGDLCRFILQS